MRIYKDYQGHLNLSLGRYSVEICLFWLRFRRHFSDRLGTEKVWVFRYQWLGRNISRLISKLPKTRKGKIRHEIEKLKSDFGMCHACGEYTSIIEPCCGVPVEFEGSSTYWEDLLHDLCDGDSKLIEYAENYIG